MSEHNTNRFSGSRHMISALFFRLLPIQVLLAAIGSVDEIVSGLFAANYIGSDAIAAIGLSMPAGQFQSAVTAMLVGGSQILSGKYMGKNQMSRTQDIFSADLLITTVISLVLTAMLVAASVFDLTSVLTSDAVTRALLNRYLLGMAVGVLPFMIGQQLSAFLSLENHTRLATAATSVYVAANLAFSYLFVVLMKMDIFGLSLATSCGLWLYCLIQASYFTGGKSLLKLRLARFRKKDAAQILGVGAPGALSRGYQVIRKLAVNGLILTYVGSIGLAAHTSPDMILGIFWALPQGINVVFRMLMSVSVGEEDRQSLTDVMRTVLYRAVPLVCGVSIVLMALASPLTMLHYSDTTSEIYRLTVWGYRLLPVCMPLSVIYMVFSCYAQATGRHVLINIMSLIDGLLGVVVFSYLLVPSLGLNGVFIANICCGIVLVSGFVIYSAVKNRKLPKTIDELAVIPEDFGVSQQDRLDMAVETAEDVTSVSVRVQQFCLEKGIDARRSYYAALCLEEMAGNVVEHGFASDDKKHSADVRVACKDGELILRIKDDCIPFDPGERQSIVDPDDAAKNIGIRMTYAVAREISYQNILGMNVLTIRI